MFNSFSKKTVKNAAVFFLTAFLFVSCSAQADNSQTNYAEGSSDQIGTAEYDTGASDFTPASDYSEFDLNDVIPTDAVTVNFSGTQADYQGDAAECRDGAFVIYKAGDYILSGDFSGRIIVNAGADDNVRLIFAGLDVSSPMAPVYIVNAKNTAITLAEGSVNRITDSADYTFADDGDEPDSALFSKCDLTINGGGSLEVNGNYACGIRSKDDITIVGGGVTVTAAKDGIKGRDSVVIRGGDIKITAGEDGIQSNNDEDAEHGYIIIEGGNIDITAGDDGISGETWLQVYDGNIIVRESCEGLESAKIEIYGGILDITASDDGINASGGSSSGEDNGEMFGGFGGGFERGDFSEGKPDDITDDGMMLNMPDGGMMPNMPEGGAMHDMSGDGMMHDMPEGGMPEMPEGGAMPESRDNGMMNGRGGNKDNRNDRGGMGGGMNFGGGMRNEMPEEGVYILIAGGTVRVEAGVDVIDSNGTFTQTGGTLITAGRSMAVYGSPDGVVDCNGSAVSEGGTFISLARSVGSSPESSNKLNGFALNTSGITDFNAEMKISDSSGNVIISFVPKTSCSLILVTSELFEENAVYTVSFGGSVIEYTCTAGISGIM